MQISIEAVERTFQLAFGFHFTGQHEESTAGIGLQELQRVIDDPVIEPVNCQLSAMPISLYSLLQAFERRVRQYGVVISALRILPLEWKCAGTDRYCGRASFPKRPCPACCAIFIDFKTLDTGASHGRANGKRSVARSRFEHQIIAANPENVRRNRADGQRRRILLQPEAACRPFGMGRYAVIKLASDLAKPDPLSRQSRRLHHKRCFDFLLQCEEVEALLVGVSYDVGMKRREFPAVELLTSGYRAGDPLGAAA
ncbi:hypothetical protein [Agrobacterium sp. FDAARGOS_525]|uniref:hypothetical protein n=1 Tax=Agrobacterium sp. FDAARGOS_525 TaxID=2420311 RepID=UPI00156265AA|nr:hypothetical protein [Agrobacterium sp. FDAARGOS_525]